MSFNIGDRVWVTADGEYIQKDGWGVVTKTSSNGFMVKMDDSGNALYGSDWWVDASNLRHYDPLDALREAVEEMEGALFYLNERGPIHGAEALEAAIAKARQAAVGMKR